MGLGDGGGDRDGLLTGRAAIVGGEAKDKWSEGAKILAPPRRILRDTHSTISGSGLAKLPSLVSQGTKSEKNCK